MPLRMPCIGASRLGKVSSIARPLLALSGHAWVHCTCLLLTQSGHRLALQSCTLNVFNFEQNLRAPYQKIGEAVRASPPYTPSPLTFTGSRWATLGGTHMKNYRLTI
jgi:hypothetical protein